MNSTESASRAKARWNPLAARVNPKFALAAVSTLVSLLVAEAVLQIFCFSWFPPVPRDYKNAFDPYLGWALIPNYRGRLNGTDMANNSLGFRGREFQHSGKVNLMILGDSFVWGHGIVQPENRFTDILQVRHSDWNVFGAGVIGYGTDQELLLLQRIFDQLHPQIVFLVFCTENDHSDNSSNSSYGQFKPYFTTNAAGLQLHGIPVPCSERAFCAEHPLWSRSYLFQLMIRAWKRLTLPSVVLHNDPTPALLLEMRKYVQSKGAEFMVGLTSADPAIERVLDQARIPFLVFKEDKRFVPDLHWDAAGHILAAERVEQFLLTNSLAFRDGIPSRSSGR